jgi:hypoxanthine-guanine phosphoribosyltransferase
LFKVGRSGISAETMNPIAQSGQLRTIISAEQIQRRVREMARQISHDYAGQTVHALALLENGFIFTADLVRILEVPVICQFIKPNPISTGNTFC